MTIEIDTSKLTLPTVDVLGKSLASALNKTVVTARKEMSQATRDYYNIKKRDLDKKIDVRKATKGNTESIINITSRPVGLIHFNATASKAFDKGQKRYFKTSAKVLKRGRKKVVNGAFIARAKNSNSWQVFERTGKSQYPLRKRAVITPTSMVENKGDDAFYEVISRDFTKNFNHEFEFYMGKAKR